MSVLYPYPIIYETESRIDQVLAMRGTLMD